MSQKNPTIRKATSNETNLIINYIGKYFGEEAKKCFQLYNFWIKQGKVKEVFALKENIENTVEKIPIQIYSAGIPIGSLWGKKFQLEVEGSALILYITDKKLIVKTDQFLYGKHVFVENVDLIASEFYKGDMILILGKNSLHYGIGKAEISSDEIKEAPTNTIIIKGSHNKPLYRGWYLRRGN